MVNIPTGDIPVNTDNHGQRQGYDNRLDDQSGNDYGLRHMQVILRSSRQRQRQRDPLEHDLQANHLFKCVSLADQADPT